MLSVYLDFTTLAWAIMLLLALPTVVLKHNALEAWVSMATVVLYLVAQSSWTTSYLSGYIFGVQWANYVWFAFNSAVMLLITINVRKH